MKHFFTDPLVIILNLIYLIVCTFGIKWGNEYLFWDSVKEVSLTFTVGFFVGNFILWRIADPNYDASKSIALLCPKCGGKLNGLRGIIVKKCPHCTADLE